MCRAWILYCFLAMTKEYLCRPETDTDQILIRKNRQCLKCSMMFDSEWAGERICRTCKTSADYQQAGSLGAEFL